MCRSLEPETSYAWASRRCRIPAFCESRHMTCSKVPWSRVARVDDSTAAVEPSRAPVHHLIRHLMLLRRRGMNCIVCILTAVCTAFLSYGAGTLIAGRNPSMILKLKHLSSFLPPSFFGKV